MTDPAAVVASVAASADAISDEPLPDFGRRDRADSGDPQVSARVLARDPASGTEVGVWACTPGGWPVKSRIDTEIAHILSGRVVITDDGGERHELGPGDAIVLPVGWSGRWDVLEDTRKLYTLVHPTD